MIDDPTDIPELIPLDEHNRVLRDNVRPPDWVNPEPASRYNLVVLGAGTAGLVTAAGAAGLGAKVALVEKNLMGGDCLNVGCVPSKCLIRSSRAVADIRAAGALGVAAGGLDVDFGAVMERMRRLRARISDHDSAERFRGLGVDVFLGAGRFAGPDTVEVDGKALRFSKAVIATGARAHAPDTPGLAEAGFRTNETIFSLIERPARLAVIGGGPLGCELAQAFQRLGSQVTLIQSRDRVLPREDPDAAVLLVRAFERDGVRVLTNAALRAVTLEDGARRLEVNVGGRVEVVEAEEILVAAGRAPNVNGLGLETVGVEFDERRGVHVDDRLRTTNRRIYAAGDVCAKFKFTHTADFAARIVLRNALFWGRSKASALTVPWCTYTDPEIAHVGLYERDAEERGIALDTYTRPLEDVDRAVADGEEEGFVKVHVKKGTGRILGATIVARHAGEMISELTLAMVNKVGLGRIASVIHPYPTQAEAIRQLGDQYNRTRLTPCAQQLFRTLLKWRR